MEKTNQPHSNIPQVLVAEDNRINQKILKVLLEKEGYVATVVANGKEALNLLNEQPFELVILDYHMPELNGLETLKAIRTHSQKNINSIPVILFTAEQDKQHIQDIQAYGIQYVLQKPLNQNQFSQVIKQIRSSSFEPETSKSISSMTYLREITSGNTELMTELIDIFIEEVPEALKKMKAFCQNSDWTSLQTLAHKLRSNYKYVGAEEGDQLLKMLEDKTIPVENSHSYSAILENLEEITFRILETLQKEKSIIQRNSDNLS